MNTIEGYNLELQAVHTVIVQRYLNTYHALPGEKNDAAVIAFANEYDGRISREIASATTDIIHKSMMEGLQGDQTGFINAIRVQNRAAYAEYVNELNGLLTGDQRLGIQY